MPSEAATRTDHDQSEMKRKLFDTTDYVRQSLVHNLLEDFLLKATDEAVMDIESRDWSKSRKPENWDKDAAGVYSYKLLIDSGASLDEWEGDLPRPIHELMEEARTDIRSLLSNFEWAEKYEIQLEERKKNGSGYDFLPEPPSADSHAGLLAVARKRRQEERADTSTASRGIAQKTINKGCNSTTKSRLRAKATRLANASSAKFSNQVDNLSERFTESNLPSVSAASLSQMEEGQDTAMELN